MKQILFTFILIQVLGLTIYGQKLNRKASLGAKIEQFENGVKIVEVQKTGTAYDLHLKPEDIVFEMNKDSIKDIKSFNLAISNFREGDKIEFKIIRGKKQLRVRGSFKAKPYETSLNSEVIYDQTNFRGGQLRVIINKPKIEGKLPAMLFIPGYSCSSIDNLKEIHPYKRIIDAYSNAGFVTLRIEKSGLGDSKNTPDCSSCNLKDEVENFEVGLIKLKSLPYVDTNKIIIVGHSMGGIVAPAISAKNQVAGVVVYGTIAKSWFEYNIEMTRIQNTLSGMNPIELEKSVREQYEIGYRFFIKKEKLTDIAKNRALDSILRKTWEYDGNGNILSRNAEYWRQIEDFPILENWKNTKAKVLVQFGESDFQAFSLADHKQIANTVNLYNYGNAILITYPSTDHYFAKSGTMQEAYNKYSNGKILQLFDEYNNEVGKSAVEWSLKVVGKE